MVGTLNADTIQLINTARCGVSDRLLQFSISTKFIKNTLLWYFSLADQAQESIATRIFDVLQEKSNLRFEYNMSNKDIVFSSGRTTHRNNYACMKGQ